MGISYKINLKRFIHEKVQTCTLYLIQDEGKGIEVCQLHTGKIVSRANAVRMEYGCVRSPWLIK